MYPRKALIHTFRLTDGRLICTLEDAARLVLGLTDREQCNPTWLNAGEMVQTAIATGRDDHIALATAQLERALTWPSNNASVRLADDQRVQIRKKPPAPSIRPGRPARTRLASES